MTMDSIDSLGIDAIRELMTHLTPLERVELSKHVSRAVWLPLPGPQMQAYYSEADELFYGGAGGGGKGLIPQEKIATPFGYRKIGDLKVGDKVLSVDGFASIVIGVYPQPKQTVYRVLFSDGGSLVTDGPHKWKYSIAGHGRWSKSGLEWKINTTVGLMDMLSEGKRPLIPLCEPLKFSKAHRYNMRVVDPYALGLLLGDGYTAQSGPGAKWSFATEDIELLNALPGEWVKDTGANYRIRGESRVFLQKEFERLGLNGCKSGTKFIPESYKWAPVAERYAVLQGLMDTDGTVTSDGKAYFCSTSRKLAEDVRWLVLSLGGRGTITHKKPICTNGANGRTPGADAWTVYIRMPDNKVLFRLTRKKDLAGEYNGGGKALKRWIVSIEPCGEEETVCICIDHPSSLYVAGDDLVVTHNSDLILGLALTQHRKSIIFRREAPQLQGLLDRLHNEILKSRAGYNGQDKVQRLDAGRQIEFGSCPHPGDEQRYQGRPHDLLALDEITHFQPSQYTFLRGWLRTTYPGQRCRIVCTGNPPVTSDGEWVIHHWAPWLDPDSPRKAKPGELIWYAMIDGKETEVPDGSVIEHNGEQIRPMSRTFIPSRVEDNPFLMATGYKSNLQALPEPLRSQLLRGDFLAGLGDDPWQMIPAEWVRFAQARWRPGKHTDRMTSVGVDVARGGTDETIIARRHGDWYDNLICYPGAATPTGSAAAALVFTALRDGAPIHVDVIGIGSSAYDHLADNDLQVIGVNSSEKSVSQFDRTGQLRFANRRAEIWWRMREALDPQYGRQLQLPPDPRLKADLCAPRWRLTSQGIRVEDKEETKKRIGRSPDRGDAAVYALIDTLPRSMYRHMRIEPEYVEEY